MTERKDAINKYVSSIFFAGLVTVPIAAGVAVANAIEPGCDKMAIQKANDKIAFLQKQRDETGKETLQVVSASEYKSQGGNVRILEQTTYASLIQEQKNVIANRAGFNRDAIAVGLVTDVILTIAHVAAVAKSEKFKRFYDNLGEALYNKLHRKKLASPIVE